jgi:hypothetical protein
MSRLRRLLLPTLISFVALGVCGKLLLTSVQTSHGFRFHNSWSYVGALEFGWPWVYYKRINGTVFPPNPPSRLDISYSRWLLITDVAVLSAAVSAIWLILFWLWRRVGYRFRYSLRGLLLSTVVVAIPFGWLARQINDWRREQFWIGELADVNVSLAQGDYVDTVSEGLLISFSGVAIDSSHYPGWLRRLWPDDKWPIFHRVWQLKIERWANLRKRPFEPVLEDALRAMSHVRHISFERDCGFKIIDPTAFSNVEQLEIGDDIDDDTLRTIATFPALCSLTISGDGITDEGLARLAECRSLKEISILSSQITDAGLASLSKCSGLENLQLHASSVTDAGVAQLARLRNLRFLSLYDTQITDASIDIIAKLPALEELWLDWNMHLTDRGVRRLVGFPKLIYGSLNLPQLSFETVDLLKHQIPNFEVR